MIVAGFSLGAIRGVPFPVGTGASAGGRGNFRGMPIARTVAQRRAPGLWWPTRMVRQLQRESGETG
jgi:hypothetical protein